MTDSTADNGVTRGNDDPSDEQVLDAVNETGFLLERQVHGALQRHGFNASIGVAYSDPQTEAHREIDVLGVMHTLVQDKIPVFMHVLIECKKWTSGPLVGIGGVPTRRERLRIPEEFRIVPDPVSKVTHKDGRRPTSFYPYQGLGTEPHPVAYAEMLATQLVLMERKQAWLAKNTAIYDSVVLPLVKAQATYADVAEIVSPPGEDGFAVAFRRSALVTTAPLKGVLWVNDEHTEVIHPHYFPVIRNFSAKGMPSNFTFEVVAADHLDAWLTTQVVPHFRAMCDAVHRWLDDQLATHRERDQS